MVSRGDVLAVTNGDFKCVIRVIDSFYGIPVLMVVTCFCQDSVLVGTEFDSNLN